MTRASLCFDAANARLSPDHRRVLALRELGRLSYAEIAEAMELGEADVARLIADAWLHLRDALRGGALAAIPARSEYCDHALALAARRWDGELHDHDDVEWLLAHLACCTGCRVREEAIEEARVSYRAWRRTVAFAA